MKPTCGYEENGVPCERPEDHICHSTWSDFFDHRFQPCVEAAKQADVQIVGIGAQRTSSLVQGAAPQIIYTQITHSDKCSGCLNVTYEAGGDKIKVSCNQCGNSPMGFNSSLVWATPETGLRTPEPTCKCVITAPPQK